MWQLFTDIFGNSEQSLTEQLSMAIENIGPDFFLVYAHNETPVSKNIWILLSIINDEIGCYGRYGKRRIVHIDSDQRSKVNVVIQLINHTMTEQDQRYLASKRFSLQHINVENVQFYSQYINPVVFYLMSKNSMLYNNLDARTLLSLIQDLDEIKFYIVKSYIRKFLDISTDRPLDTQLEQMLSQGETLTDVTKQAEKDWLSDSRYQAIPLQNKFVELLAKVDWELENLKETYFSIPESQKPITDFNQRFLKLVEQRDKNYSSIYDLKITNEELEKLCINFQFHITEATNLCEEIKGYQFSKDQLVQKIQEQKKSFHELISQIKIPVDLTRSEEGKRVLEKQKSSLVEKIIWGWYLGYTMNYVGIKLSEDSTYEILVDAYKENHLILKKLSELKDFFEKLLLHEKQHEWSVQQQIREKLLGLLSETIKNKIISINSTIESLLQILFYSEEKHEHLNLLIGIVNLVVEMAKMWLSNVGGKNVLSLSEDDVYHGLSNVNRLDKVKDKLSGFLINSRLWGILKEQHTVEVDLESKKNEKEHLRVEMREMDRNKKSEFIKVLDDFKKGIQQKIPHDKRKSVMVIHNKYVGVRIGNAADKIGLFKQVSNRLNNIKGQFEMPFVQWIQEIQTSLESREDFGKLNKLLQHQLNTLREYCNAFKKDFDAYSEIVIQKLDELNNEISELERQQQEIQNTVKAMISNLDAKAKSVDFGLRDEKKDNDDDHEVKVLSETLELLKNFDQCIPIMEGMLKNLLESKASEVEKCIKDIATLKASKEKCIAVLECANLPPGVLDCLRDYLSMCIEAVDALSEKMVSLGDDSLHQQSELNPNFNI